VTATAQPSAPVEAPPQGALDRAHGVELLGDVHGSGYKEGAALVRRGDGQMVQLGPLMYALLECVDGQRDPAELAACLSESTGRTFDEEHVIALAEKLAAQGLLAGTEDKAPPRSNPLLALRWKVLVTNPQITKRLTAPFTMLFRPWLLWPILAAFLAVCWFVLIHKGVASATHQAFHNPELLLLVFVLSIASAGFHELGHASACRYGGGTPGGMGMGLYLVWPAFYTDVTDAYRLPRRDRLRTDLGGLYFNTIVSVATIGAWLVWHVDALLLLVAVQLIEMVKQLSPMIRADGYHILADATGVPDLYAHIGPTLKRLLPGHGREPSALSGRARTVVTLWVLVVVPVLLSLAVGAILLFPRLLATGWESARHIGSAIPGQVEHGQILGLIISLGRLLGLCLPVAGTFLMAQKLLQSLLAKGRAWSGGRPLRRGVLVAAAAAATCGVALAWWPAGQYQPIRATERGTLVSFVSAPTHAARPAPQPRAVQLAPGPHLAVSMIPVGGATKEHPALFVIAGTQDKPAVAILIASTPPAQAAEPGSGPAATEPATTTTGQVATTTVADPSTTSTPVQGTAFPFKLPSAPRPGDSQAVAVGTKDGAVTYDVAYSLVTVTNGAPVNSTNSAFAFANCRACTTVAVSFQVVLIVGRSNTIAPVNAAGALNVNCPACITTAIADQIVVTLKSQPSDELVAQLRAALEKLNALPALGGEGSPAAIAAAVVAVQQQIDAELANSGLLTNPPTSTTPAATTTARTPTTSTPTTAATSSSGSAAPAGSSTTTTAATEESTTTTAPTTTTPATPPPTTTTETTPTTTTG
jgi:putative peptide zinc metalloprotease protein